LLRVSDCVIASHVHVELLGVEQQQQQ